MKFTPWLVGLVLLVGAGVSRAALVLQPNDRVGVCGDGLPDNGAGVYFESYLMAAEPSLRAIDIHQFAWVQGDLLSRLDADVLPEKPTVVVLAYAFADDPGTHEKKLTDLVAALKKAGVRLIVVGSPPAARDADYPNDPPSRVDRENHTRSAIAEMNKRVAASSGCVYADVFHITQAAIEKARTLHGDAYAKQPGWSDAFQLAVASAFLKAVGCAGDIATLDIDFAARRVQGTLGQKISAMEAESPDFKFTVESSRYGFWFPGHGVGGADAPPWSALQCLTFDAELNRYILKASHLPTAQAKIYWGDHQRDFTADELAKGVNLPATMPAWNSFAASNVDNAVRHQQEIDRDLGNRVNQKNPDPQASAKHDAEMQVVRDRAVPLQMKLTIVPLETIEKQPAGPIPVILDTDMNSDVDDVGALALLDSFMVQGQATLLAVVHDSIDADQSSCATIKTINTWYGHPDVPIGQYLGEHPAHLASVVIPAPEGKSAYHDPAQIAGSHYTLKIHQRFAPEFPNDDKMPAGVDVYRKALASAEDGKVVMISVGLMENIQDLVLSQPDSVSPLCGIDLVRKKVRQLVIMANTQPADLYLLSKWPTPILWTCDVGSYIGTGPSLIATPENNPVRFAYDLFGVLHTGRQSWDLTASWLAIRGAGELFDAIAGRPKYINDIVQDPQTKHPQESVVTIKLPYEEVSKIIGAELARPPKK